MNVDDSDRPGPSPTGVGPTPPITADEVFARTLNRWLAAHPHSYRDVQRDARTWLTAKGLG